MTSSPSKRSQAPSEDDRYGLDLLATAIDDVAAQLPPSKLVPMKASKAQSPEAPFPESPRRSTAPLPHRTAPRSATSHRLWALAAAVLVALLAWPAYLGWVELPKLHQQLADAGAMDGPVGLALLSPPRQGERAGSSAPPTQLVLAPQGSAVWLLELPHGVRPQLQEGAHIELASVSADDATTEPTKRWTLSGESLAVHLAQHDGVPLLLQTRDLAPGIYRLQWLDLSGNRVSSVDLELVKP